VPPAGDKGLAGLALRLPRIEFLLEPQCIGIGGAALAGDVAIDSGLITRVGGKAGPGRREIDVDGLLVTPGWIDVHTHYDGQAT
jgi:imidazolonepropionase-like amidohydrolase